MRPRIVVYLAGPYRAATEWEQHRNIQDAAVWANAIWKAGAICLSPIQNTAYMNGSLPDDEILEGDIELLKRCDVLVAKTGWENSEGAKAEHAVAKDLHMPVFYSIAELEDWIAENGGV